MSMLTFLQALMNFKVINSLYLQILKNLKYKRYTNTIEVVYNFITSLISNGIKIQIILDNCN